MRAVLRVLAYLARTKDRVLRYAPDMTDGYRLSPILTRRGRLATV